MGTKKRNTICKHCGKDTAEKPKEELGKKESFLSRIAKNLDRMSQTQEKKGGSSLGRDIDFEEKIWGKNGAGGWI